MLKLDVIVIPCCNPLIALAVVQYSTYKALPEHPISVISVEFAHKRSKEATTCASSAIFSFNNLRTKTRFLLKFYIHVQLY